MVWNKRKFVCQYCKDEFDDRTSLTEHKPGCQERIRGLESLKRRFPDSVVHWARREKDDNKKACEAINTVIH